MGDDLLAGRLRLSPHPPTTIRDDPKWSEDPFEDANWRYQYHSLRWVEPLWAAWRESQDSKYLHRYTFLLRDWSGDNPPANPPSPSSWDDHAAAFRGVVYACAARRLDPPPTWLRRAADLHGEILASDSFLSDIPNHALNQSIGLLALGCTFRRDAWRDVARARIERLGLSAIDEQGVNNEQAVSYHSYNYSKYKLAFKRLRACGIKPAGNVKARLRRMPGFTGWATEVDGRYALLGDTPDDRVTSVRGTVAEYMSSRGDSGPRPKRSATVWKAGYAFFRSGWGEERSLVDETAISVRFGPGRAFHGHNDAAAVTLAAFGDRLLLDSGGPFHYEFSDWHGYFVSERAHNTISVDDAPMQDAGETTLIRQRLSRHFDFIVLRHEKIPGTVHLRSVFYSRTLDLLVVADDLASESPRTYRQWWHLHPDARPRLTADGLVTERPDRSNVSVQQLSGEPKAEVFVGSTDPIQGWVTWAYKKRTPAPAVSFAQTGQSARYITVIAPSRREATAPKISEMRARPQGGYVLEVAHGGKRARIDVGTTSASQSVMS